MGRFKRVTYVTLVQNPGYQQDDMVIICRFLRSREGLLQGCIHRRFGKIFLPSQPVHKIFTINARNLKSWVISRAMCEVRSASVPVPFGGWKRAQLEVY